jgi:ABC-type transport system involved in multi-copper enzyme maturation permease subunit
MTWLIWRQHRRQAIAASIALGIAAVVLVVTGFGILATYHTALRTCATGLGGCGNLDGQVFQGGYNRFFDLVDAVGFALPILFAIFWGAPLVAREIEEGVHRLAWSQSITRLRWLGVKLAWALGAAALTAGAWALLVSWWYRPINAIQQNRFGSIIFDTQALVPIGYAVCGVALGCLIGALFRRSLLAMGTTLGVFGVFRYLFDTYVRPYLLPGRSLRVGVTNAFGNAPAGPGSWLLSEKLINASGQSISINKIDPYQLPLACREVYYSDSGLDSCLSHHGYHVLVNFQPASHYWPMQGIELAVYLALAALLVAATCLWARRADA